MVVVELDVVVDGEVIVVATSVLVTGGSTSSAEQPTSSAVTAVRADHRRFMPSLYVSVHP